MIKYICDALSSTHCYNDTGDIVSAGCSISESSVYTCSSLFPFVCLYLYKHVFYFFLFIGITYLLFEVSCMYVCYLLFPINNNNNLMSSGIARSA